MMAYAGGRLSGIPSITVSEGWTASRLTQPSRLHGANGMRTGPDGRIYVAQVPGSAISAIDIDSGKVETVCAIDGPVTAPDDLVFDEQGNMFITEVTLGKVSMLAPDGSYRVVNGDMPVANPITIHQDRLIAGECRPGGRVMELDKQTGEQRIILDDAPMPNAFSVGPDGKLYMPMMAVNEIWRIDLAGGAPEVVAKDLGVPDSIKFDSAGQIISTQVASGEVLRIDPQTGSKQVLASVAPGLDNCTFVGDRLFVSSISGQVTEVLADGQTRALVPDGLQWPMGLALAEDGSLFIADGAYSYLLSPDGTRQMIGFLFFPGYPGFARGVAADGPGQWLTTNAGGQVMRWNLAEQASEVVAEGFEILFDVDRASDGSVVFADGGAGRVLRSTHGSVEELAAGLDRPMGVAISDDGSVLVSENGAGRIVRLTGGGKMETVIDGLKEPQGIAVSAHRIYVLDVGSRDLLSFASDGSDRQVIASKLPVKAPPGITPKILGGVGNLSGPMESFAGLEIAANGTILVAGDAEGSVLAFKPEKD